MSDDRDTQRRRGVAYGLIASLLWGTVFVSVRYLVDRLQVDPFLAAAYRFSGGAAALVAWVAITGQGRRLTQAARNWPRFLALGVTGIAGLGVCVMLSAQYTDSIKSSMIVNANAVFIALFAGLAGERVGLRRGLAVAIGLVGCAFVVGGGQGLRGLLDFSAYDRQDVIGGLYAVGAAVGFALYTVIGKGAARDHGGLIATTASMVLGAALLWAFVPLLGEWAPLDWRAIAVLAYVAVAPTAVGFALWYKGAQMVDASLLGPLQYVAPVVSTALGWGLLGEEIGAAFLIGTALVLAALHLATKGSDER